MTQFLSRELCHERIPLRSIHPELSSPRPHRWSFRVTLKRLYSLLTLPDATNLPFLSPFFLPRPLRSARVITYRRSHPLAISLPTLFASSSSNPSTYTFFDLRSLVADYNIRLETATSSSTGDYTPLFDVPAALGPCVHRSRRQTRVSAPASREEDVVGCS